MNTKTILFVCTGNTCRSSMAAALFKNLIEQSGDGKAIKILSAGTAAFEGQRASPNAIAVMDEKGVDLRGHRAAVLTREKIMQSDLILTMTNSHKNQVIKIAPEAAGKTYTLKEYTNISDGNTDIFDPFGQSIDTYRKSAQEIEFALKILLKMI